MTIKALFRHNPWLLPFAVVAAAALFTSRSGPRRPSILSRRTSLEEKAEILHTLSALGWPSAELDRVIRNESGWNATATNPVSHAVGLIQFMPATLRGYGFPGTWEDYRVLPPLEQLPWMVKYFSGPPHWEKPGDTYLRVFYPAAVARPDDHVIASQGSKIWSQNPGLRDGYGPITAGSVRRHALG